jgi:hypothetical protein
MTSCLASPKDSISGALGSQKDGYFSKVKLVNLAKVDLRPHLIFCQYAKL